MVWDGLAPLQFQPDGVPDEDVHTILALAAQAPSAFNLQPWRFVVVRDQAQRELLGRAARDQSIIAAAPVVVATYGLRGAWGGSAGELAAGVYDVGSSDAVGTGGDPEATALGIMSRHDLAVWLNRHVMIAFTYMMVAAEALGWDTAPMEGFDALAVREVLALPADAELVALLAIGRLAEPRPTGLGRLPLEKLASAERHGIAWRHPACALG